MTRLTLNLSMLGPRPTGLGVYAEHCAVAACNAFESDLITNNFGNFHGRLALRAPDNIVFGSGRLAALRRWVWARRWHSGNETLVYSPTHHGLPGARKQILTVHDLIALRFPRQHRSQYLFFRFVLPRQLKKCHAIFTVSETTKQDILQTYGVAEDKIFVVPNGVDTTVFRPSSTPTMRQPFLLMVGASLPHKNVEELIAMSSLWKGVYKLRIASCRGKHREYLEQLIASEGLSANVEFLAYVDPDELVRLYQTCSAFVYPSKWEGFGIPPLEALACGAPVIASDIPAHREVLGDSAVFVTLGSKASWKAAFETVVAGRPSDLNDDSHAVRRWTWAHSARKLAESLMIIQSDLVKKAASGAKTATAQAVW